MFSTAPFFCRKERLMAKEMSTAELAQQLGNPALVVIDVRPMAAFNGWQLQGETWGGHIRGAIAFPVSWLDTVEAAELKTLAESKGITRDKTVVVYGYTHDDSAAMVQWLSDLGYENLLAYKAGLAEWAAHEGLPMARLARYEKLVHPEWVHRLVNDKDAPTSSGKGYAIFHVNSGAREEYEKGHIPGALSLDTNALEKAPVWNRVPDRELEAVLISHGITHDKTVVLYGRCSHPDPDAAEPGVRAGLMAAARAAAILMYAGVEDVRLLDGGYDAWVSAGYEVETGVRGTTPVTAFGARLPAHPGYIIDVEEARALLEDPDGVLVSVRSWPEFIGEVSGYDYIEPKGRIPGAVWGTGGSDAYHMQQYRNVDCTMRNYHEIEANWRETGITPDKRVAFYCGTGWRASETFFCAHLMGWEQVAVYDGGWLEWSQDESNPIEVGEP
jgi:thiosulfate/3-mercaptopyruvate sulfurtransferase